MTLTALALRLLTLVSDPDAVSEAPILGPPPPVADCGRRLREAGARARDARIPVHRARRGGHQCGAPQVVTYVRGPGRIRYGSSPKLTCQMALAMTTMEQIVQQEAHRGFGRRVIRIEHAGTYNCREMAAYPGWVSEHSYANAIDLKAFVLSGGQRVEVREYGKGVRGEFLRAVARRLFDEGVFSVVLTPAFDGRHRSHMHLDMAPYSVDGTGIVDR